MCRKLCYSAVVKAFENAETTNSKKQFYSQIQHYASAEHSSMFRTYLYIFTAILLARQQTNKYHKKDHKM